MLGIEAGGPAHALLASLDARSWTSEEDEGVREVSWKRDQKISAGLSPR